MTEFSISSNPFKKVRIKERNRLQEGKVKQTSHKENEKKKSEWNKGAWENEWLKDGVSVRESVRSEVL